MGGFAKGVGLCSAFVAELWGVLEGLRYVHRMGLVKVELNIDSEAVVQVVKNRYMSSSLGVALVKQIWRLLDMNWEVEVSHTYREANKCADALANLGCSLANEIVFYDRCPSHISDLCNAQKVPPSRPCQSSHVRGVTLPPLLLKSPYPWAQDKKELLTSY
ncbi:unnamed protein product [Trifolium pratense]|uniref:Uncharacterized protein n=1 Tax=Trifolium pratense TaxID=57577 RepID=A0ACB0MBQ9_TRIPR|nr:unnamed protein product [Trifolium pratense]